MRREITGFIALVIFAGCIYWRYGEWLSAAVASICYIFAHYELYSLLGIPHRKSLLVWQNLLAILFFFFTAAHHYEILVVLSFLFFGGSCLISMKNLVKGSRYEIAIHGLLLIYLLFPLSCFVYLRSIESGPLYLFFMLAIACFTDIGAYYGGNMLGKHKLAPILSPHKTWEGAISGALLAVLIIVISTLIYGLFDQTTLWLQGSNRYLHIIMVTLILSAIGQVGDLCESVMKRDAGIKDSGITPTGHGGFLDMMDSMLWIGPAMFVYVLLFHSIG